MVRKFDLARGTEVGRNSMAPDERRADVAPQLRRPAFSRVSELGIRYLPQGELRSHRAAIDRFGARLKPLLELSIHRWPRPPQSPRFGWSETRLT